MTTSRWYIWLIASDQIFIRVCFISWEEVVKSFSLARLSDHLRNMTFSIQGLEMRGRSNPASFCSYTKLLRLGFAFWSWCAFFSSPYRFLGFIGRLWGISFASLAWSPALMSYSISVIKNAVICTCGSPSTDSNQRAVSTTLAVQHLLCNPCCATHVVQHLLFNNLRIEIAVAHLLWSLLCVPP